MGSVTEFLPGTGRWHRVAMTEGVLRQTRRSMPIAPSTTCGGPPPRTGED